MRGDSEERLVLHLAGAIADDVPRAAIVEALIQLSVYGGFQAALNAFTAADKAFASPAAEKKDDRPARSWLAIPRHRTYAASKGG